MAVRRRLRSSSRIPASISRRQRTPGIGPLSIDAGGQQGVYTPIMSPERRAHVTRGGPDMQVCAHASLRKATRVVSQAYDAALKPSGLRATQFTLLAVLARAGEMPVTKLAETLVMERTTLTRNLRPLMSKGWLKTGRDGDERIRLVSITAAGRRVLAEATPLWRVAQSRITAGVGRDRLSRLLEDLAVLVDAS